MIRSNETHRDQAPKGERGFVLVFTILLILGVSAITVGTLYNNHMNRLTALNYKHHMQTFHAADGVVTLLAQEILDGRSKVYIDTSKMGKVYGDVWTGLGGTTVGALKAAINGGVPRSRKDSSTYLGSNWSSVNYGVRWRGWLSPPFTGAYKFHLRSHMASHFYFNPNGSDSIDYAAAATAPACSLTVAEAAAVKGWPAATGVSATVFLQAGKFYYFQYFHKVGSVAGTDDMGQVGWEGPEWLREFPIPRARLFRDTSAQSYSRMRVGDRADSSSVRYQVSLSGFEQYALSVEAVQKKAGSSTDTLYRAPLNQLVSIRGKTSAPPDSVKLPVIYYDYRADGSNPEFQATFNQMTPMPPPPLHPYLWNGYAVTGLVKNNQLRYVSPPTVPASHLTHFGLGSIPKPIPSATKTMITCNLDRWFVPWVAGAAANAFEPQYANITLPNYTGAWPAPPCDDGGDETEVVCWKGTYAYYRPAGAGLCTATPCFRYAGNNCALVPAAANNFENKVKLDSVNFLLQPNGSYKFSRSMSDGTGRFAPLDGWGFGNNIWKSIYDAAGVTHNWGFCMELHAPFVHASGLTFDFSGDDDVWVFIDDSLVIDLGFVHAEETRSLNLDDLPLTFGQTYRLDMFYCERSATGSNILINTNIPLNRPKGDPVVSWKRNYGSVD
jgi:fibro-slime domain-containing protein